MVDGNWAGGLSGLVGATADALSLVLNPLGTLATSVASFLLDRFEPFQRFLDELAGNPAEVEAAATTWGNVTDELTNIGIELNQAAQESQGCWTGEAAETFRENMSSRREDVNNAKEGIPVIVTGLILASGLVSAVREIISDLCADIVGKIISWVAKAVWSLGLATPLIAADAGVTIKKWIARAQEYIDNLLTSMGTLGDLLKQLAEFYQEHRDKFEAIDSHIMSRLVPGVTTGFGDSITTADNVANR